MSSLKHLFASVQIGHMTVKNRLLMPAMSVNFGVDNDGYVTEQLTEYFVARAKGGTGMILVGGGGVDPIGRELPELPALWDDACIPALKKMTERVKSFGAKFGMQIMHGGRQTYAPEKVAPSPIPAPALVKGIPKELSIAEIRELISAFGNSARRCKDAGFDFIEIHAAHGYLINQFMSQNSNKRTDEYGGIYENRIRFLLEVFREIKMKTGDDFPVGVRFNGEDYIKDGWTIDEAVRLSLILEKERADYLHISAGVYGSSQLTIPSMYVAQGCFAHLAKEIKKNVSIPVVAVGRIKDPELANKLIMEGNADIVAMGRSHLTDPELANKARSGNIASIRPCIGCCLGCIHNVLTLEPASCVVNPQVGREYQLKKLAKKTFVSNASKKVLVLGAGVGGLAAARSTSLCGHHVIVLEKEGFIGGMARLAAIPPGRSDILDIIKFFENELCRLNVEIRLNVRVNKELVNKIKPDEVVIATGSLPNIPLIKGLSKTNMNLCTAIDILKGDTVVSDNAIVLGGNQTALLLADYLAEKGKEVVVLNRENHFASTVAANDRFYLRERLKKNSVQLYKKVSIKEILSDGVIFRHAGQEKRLERFAALSSLKEWNLLEK
eukprot:CAMPEP_0201281734 /NCGR_PEP_ID=MMETSP1317-20130820/3928_1 /ASSEMBLY_ACC=CAM_ASM_000770 /TAXON_ID=187299 /ORGANISM="Undescribed Undescribed, Strain Undescribed" /LENGTH=609 /DNA_ID=CAMNT_0047592475 /DNA_START=710 /DNA_END=2540 /DNA_ORIENTATION=-